MDRQVGSLPVSFYSYPEFAIQDSFPVHPGFPLLALCEAEIPSYL